MNKEILRPEYLKPVPNKFCPGCLHSMAAKLIGECLDELVIRDKAVLALSVGCSSMGAKFWNVDMISCPHGRAPAVATGVKRCRPDAFVFSYQGDGDLASIGLSEIMYAANRGEKISVVFYNNATYGMTGGQMAPTTLVGQKTSTSPNGRCAETEGYPIDMCRVLDALIAPSYIARFALNSPANVCKAKAGIRKAFQNQLDGKPFSFVELLGNCPTNWGMPPLDSLRHIEERTLKVFPLGVGRDIDKEA